MRLIGYGVAAVGATLMLCSAHHSNEMRDIERMAYTSRSQAYNDKSDGKITDETLRRTSDVITPMETRAREQKIMGLKGCLAGMATMVLGFGMTRIPLKRDPQ